MTFIPLFGPIIKLSLSFVTFQVSHFPVSHLTHETVKLCLQNTLNMSKTTRVYFGVLQRPPAIDANDFELKPALITMVQQNQFTGHSTENPNEHLGRFLRIANSIKLNGVRPEVIQLQLFPFSLRYMAATWFNSLPYESVNTWEKLMEAYFNRFFPPSLPSEQRREITNSKHGGDENMYTAWKDLAEYMLRPNDIYKFKALLPEDYCLIPGNGAIKLVGS